MTTKILSERALAAAVDRLADLNAEISALTKRANEIKGKLIDSGLGEIEGRLHRAVISPVTSQRLDTAAAKSYLSPAEIAACTKISETIKVSLYDL